MTTPELIEHVEEAIARSLRSQAYFDKEVLDIRGFSTPTQRRLMSNLAHIPFENPVYLEAGLYAGSTLCAAINNNRGLIAYGIEDGSQNFQKEGIPEELRSNIQKYGNDPKQFTFIEGDFFNDDTLEKVTDPVCLYYYDAVHDVWAQRDHWKKILPKLADMCLVVVDDFSWESVKTGTMEGLLIIEDMIKIEKEWILDDGFPDGPLWHNAVALFLVSKLARTRNCGSLIGSNLNR